MWTMEMVLPREISPRMTHEFSWYRGKFPASWYRGKFLHEWRTSFPAKMAFSYLDKISNNNNYNPSVHYKHTHTPLNRYTPLQNNIHAVHMRPRSIAGVPCGRALPNSLLLRSTRMRSQRLGRLFFEIKIQLNVPKVLANTLSDVLRNPKKMRLKNVVLRYNKKSGNSGSVAPKWKMAGNLHRIDCHLPKIGLNAKFLGYSNSPWTGTNMHTWYFGLNKSCQKVPEFLKSHTGSEKHRLCVPTHVRTDLFTLKKFHLRLCG